MQAPHKICACGKLNDAVIKNKNLIIKWTLCGLLESHDTRALTGTQSPANGFQSKADSRQEGS